MESSIYLNKMKTREGNLNNYPIFHDNVSLIFSLLFRDRAIVIFYENTFFLVFLPALSSIWQLHSYTCYLYS